MQGYDTAQICENGHIINNFALSRNQINKTFCPSCGRPTIMACPKCDTPSNGFYHSQGIVVGSRPHAPSYCHGCGSPSPGPDAALQAARDLVNEAEDLSSEEKRLFAENVGDLLTESPRTALAAQRVKRILTKAGTGIASAARSILVDVASESVGKTLWK